MGFGSRPRTRTEGLTNTENTPYGVFSVLEGERQGLGIIDDEHTPVWRVFCARGARLGRALARSKKEEKSGRTLYTCAPVAFPTLSLSLSRRILCVGGCGGGAGREGDIGGDGRGRGDKLVGT